MLVNQTTNLIGDSEVLLYSNQPCKNPSSYTPNSNITYRADVRILLMFISNFSVQYITLRPGAEMHKLDVCPCSFEVVMIIKQTISSHIMIMNLSEPVAHIHGLLI